MNFPEGGPNMIVDDGGDATLMIHLGVKGEKDPKALDYEAESADERELLAIMRQNRLMNANFWPLLKRLPRLRAIHTGRILPKT